MDKVIAPNAEEFSEKLLYLPCYQPNDSQRPIGKSTTKIENNLPENAFVFCCFNQTFKITAEMFAVWMRILKQAPNSVLWLLDCNPWAKANLLREAENAGIDKVRLVFAPRVPIDQHLARHTHADLFLDTLPYNAHTTASDALFMNVPVLTCSGQTFASRVAQSLLNNVGLPELVADNLDAYQEIAIDLYKNYNKIINIKQILKNNINNSFAFNSAVFTQALEARYSEVWQNLSR